MLLALHYIQEKSLHFFTHIYIYILPHSFSPKKIDMQKRFRGQGCIHGIQTMEEKDRLN